MGVYIHDYGWVRRHVFYLWKLFFLALFHLTPFPAQQSHSNLHLLSTIQYFKQLRRKCICSSTGLPLTLPLTLTLPSTTITFQFAFAFNDTVFQTIQETCSVLKRISQAFGLPIDSNLMRRSFYDSQQLLPNFHWSLVIHVTRLTFTSVIQMKYTRVLIAVMVTLSQEHFGAECLLSFGR